MTSRTVFQLLTVLNPLVGAVPGSLRPLILRQADMSSQQKPATPSSSIAPCPTSSSSTITLPNTVTASFTYPNNIPTSLFNSLYVEDDLALSRETVTATLTQPDGSRVLSVTEVKVWNHTTVANLASTISTTLRIPSITGTSPEQTPQGLWPIICAYPHDSSTTTAPNEQSSIDSVSAEEKANRALAAWAMTEKITFTDGAVARSFKIPFVGSAGSVLAGVNLEGKCESDQIIDPEWAKHIWSDINKRCKGQDSSHFGGSERYRFNEHCAYNFVLYPGPLVTTVAPGTTRPAFGTGITGSASTLRPTISQTSMGTAGASTQNPGSASITIPHSHSSGLFTVPTLASGSASAQWSARTAELASELAGATTLLSMTSVQVSSLATLLFTPTSTDYSQARVTGHWLGESLGPYDCAYAPTPLSYGPFSWQYVGTALNAWDVGEEIHLTTENASIAMRFREIPELDVDIRISLGSMCPEGKYDIDPRMTKLVLMDLADRCLGQAPQQIGGTERLPLTGKCTVVYELHTSNGVDTKPN